MFIYQALFHIQPTTSMNSGVHFGIKCEVTFQGHMVLHTKITALNHHHYPYPWRVIRRKDVIIIVNEVVAEIRGISIGTTACFGDGKEMEGSMRVSSTYCLLPPPPHMPIKPFCFP